jgi:hypothetical protein
LQIAGYTNLVLTQEPGGEKGGIPGGMGTHKGLGFQILYVALSIFNVITMVKSIVQSVAKGALGRIVEALSGPRAWLQAAREFFLEELPAALREISPGTIWRNVKAFFLDARLWASVRQWRNYRSFLFTPRWFGTLEQVGGQSLYTWEHMFLPRMLERDPLLRPFVNSYLNTFLRLPMELNRNMGVLGLNKMVFYYGAARALITSWGVGQWFGNKILEGAAPTPTPPRDVGAASK